MVGHIAPAWTLIKEYGHEILNGTGLPSNAKTSGVFEMIVGFGLVQGHMLL